MTQKYQTKEGDLTFGWTLTLETTRGSRNQRSYLFKVHGLVIKNCSGSTWRETTQWSLKRDLRKIIFREQNELVETFAKIVVVGFPEADSIMSTTRLPSLQRSELKTLTSLKRQDQFIFTLLFTNPFSYYWPREKERERCHSYFVKVN